MLIQANNISSFLPSLLTPSCLLSSHTAAEQSWWLAEQEQTCSCSSVTVTPGQGGSSTTNTTSQSVTLSWPTPERRDVSVFSQQ